MKILWIIVMILALSTEVSALDFRGIEIGSNVSEAKKIAATIARSEIIQEPNNFTFEVLIKDVSVQVKVISDKNEVVQILFNFSRENYSIIKDAMIDKYGSKFTITRMPYETNLGVASDYERVSWVIKANSLLLSEKMRFDELESEANIYSTEWFNKQLIAYKSKNKSKPGF